MKVTHLVVGLAMLIPTSVSAHQSSVVASGSATVELTADRATVTVAIETADAAASTAGTRNAEVVQDVRSALVALGIEADAVTTAHYNIRTNWRRQSGDRVPDGYVADSTLRIELHDIALAGPAIDAALAGGANRVDGVEFGASGADAARQEAMGMAVKDAMNTARAMAAAAGGELGTLIELTTEGATRPVMAMQPMVAEMARADAPTQITPAALTVTARVVGRWSYGTR
jgi:hypothetical protein